MILTGSEISNSVAQGLIVLDPFSSEQINPNSYNYRLGPTLKEFTFFDGRKSNFKEVILPNDGYVLKPNQMYLGSTLEVIGSSQYAMSLIGRSSLGRLGLFLQVSANLGHTASSHKWTLELVACRPIKVYPGMIIGQISFWENDGEVIPYQGFYGQHSLPTESAIQQ